MQWTVQGRVSALLMISFVTACDLAAPAAFEPGLLAKVVPPPPNYTPAQKQALAAEIDAAPKSDLIVSALVDASVYYDQIRRLRQTRAKN